MRHSSRRSKSATQEDGMRSRLDEQLDELKSEMIHMGNMIEQSIQRAVKAFMNRDEYLAKEVMAGDAQVDRIQKTIENICFNLLIQQQPVASDLRTITAAMKMVTDMERIGDHAADISEMTISMTMQQMFFDFQHIKEMASETVLMLNWSIEAYVERDKMKAKKVIDYDDVVDRLFMEVKMDIIELIRNDPKEGEEATDLLMVAKYFERIGDHATNIAEWVIYSLKGSKEEDI